MNPATFVVGAIVGAATAIAWTLVALHPPHHHSLWNLVLAAAIVGACLLALGVLALLVDGVQRG